MCGREQPGSAVDELMNADSIGPMDNSNFFLKLTGTDSCLFRCTCPWSKPKIDRLKDRSNVLYATTLPRPNIESKSISSTTANHSSAQFAREGKLRRFTQLTTLILNPWIQLIRVMNRTASRIREENANWKENYFASSRMPLLSVGEFSVT